MPFVRIDVTQGRTPVELRALSRGIHHAIVADYGIPERDYFHVLTEHPAGQILAQDACLGLERTPDVVMIQILTQAGRSTSPVSSASPARSPQGLRPLPATRAGPRRHSDPPCHVVNMSVQTFDST
ncbi:tautomerase family protein [Pseudarthrobacter sp. So.54]